MTINILDIPTDKDGRHEVRPATAKKGASMYYSGPTFIAAKENSGDWKKILSVPP